MPTSRTFAHAKPLAATLALLATCIILSLPASAGEVEVRFVDPDKFADVGRSNRERERTMSTLADYLKSLGRELPADQTLRIEVKDIDLAGNIEPFGWYRFDEVRVLRGRADWPRVHLSYTLQADGRTLKAGDAQLADLTYMYSLRGRDRGVETLSYEKRMVRRWFDETFAAAR
ncbi:MAG: DUF3016 domain-containing protein [Rubrivivax sp.]|nr:DUF3016 domain-containing protein [Rubrivivax sp.]